MDDCNHIGKRNYARKIFQNLTEHICVQCQGCGAIVRMPEHDEKLWLKPEDIPAGKKIILFDELKYEARFNPDYQGELNETH